MIAQAHDEIRASNIFHKQCSNVRDTDSQSVTRFIVQIWIIGIESVLNCLWNGRMVGKVIDRNTFLSLACLRKLFCLIFRLKNQSKTETAFGFFQMFWITFLSSADALCVCPSISFIHLFIFICHFLWLLRKRKAIDKFCTS